MPRFQPAFKKRKNIFNPMGRKKVINEESECDEQMTPSSRQSVLQKSAPLP